MKRSVFNAWIKELRNPANKQAKGFLCLEDGSRCCLGVLCDVLQIPKRLTAVQEPFVFSSLKCFLYGYDANEEENVYTLSNDIWKEQGLYSYAGDRRDGKVSLATLNDGIDAEDVEEEFRDNFKKNPKTFNEIADILEANPLDYLKSIEEDEQQHNWVPSKLGHGESQCTRCFITNREAAALGILNKCEG